MDEDDDAADCNDVEITEWNLRLLFASVLNAHEIYLESERKSQISALI